MRTVSTSTCPLHVLAVAAAVLLNSVGWTERLAGGERPQSRLPVTLRCQALGWSAQEVELHVSHPLEAVLRTAPHVRRLVSKSANGRAVIWVDFDPRVESHRARQIVAEKLKQVVELPDEVEVQLAPPCSGEILLISLHRASIPKEDVKRNALAMALREAAQLAVRPRVLAVNGVADVEVIGGLRREFQVIASHKRLSALDITLGELGKALVAANANVPAGKKPNGNKETLIRGIGQFQSVDDIQATVVAMRDARPIHVRDVAEVRIGSAEQRSDHPPGAKKSRDRSSHPTVVLAVRLQDGAVPGKVSRQINDALRSLGEKLPPGVTVQRKLPEGANDLAKRTIRELHRDLPPDIRVEYGVSERADDVIRVKTGGQATLMLYGSDLEILRRKADDVRQRMATIRGLTDPRVEPPPNTATLNIKIDRQKAARYGVTARQVGDVVQTATFGRVVAQVHQQRRKYDVVVMIDHKGSDADFLGRCSLRAPGGSRVPVQAVVDVARISAPPAIYRSMGLRTVFIMADLSDRNMAELKPRIEEALKPVRRSLPEGYLLTIGSE